VVSKQAQSVVTTSKAGATTTSENTGSQVLTVIQKQKDIMYSKLARFFSVSEAKRRHKSLKLLLSFED